ncbi:PKD domain-containing protein [Roseibium album]|uniref:PKD domain-containing protein n=1 Tax=Roseibium album TaxID=311410 RepID=UPI002490E8C5|nr:LamG-like jellyroll fold domain-containing protein [Roseibium album]
MKRGNHFGGRFGVGGRPGLAFGRGAWFGGEGVSEPTAPSDIILSASSVDENALPGSTVALIVATGNPIPSLSIVSDPDNKFSLSGSSLMLGAALDYETATSHQVTIRADNGVGSPYDETFTIDVNNIVEDGEVDFGALTVALQAGYPLPPGATEIANAGGTNLIVSGSDVVANIGGAVPGVVTFNDPASTQWTIVVSPNTRHVKGLAELDAAMAAALAADAGWTIKLRGDGDYSSAKWEPGTFEPTQTVTILADDRSNPPVFDQISFDGTDNIIADGVRIKWTIPDQSDPTDPYRQETGFVIVNSAGVTVLNSVFEGDFIDNPDADQDGNPTGLAIQVRASSDVLFEDCEAFNWRSGFSNVQTDGVTTRRCEFHDFRQDFYSGNEVRDCLIEYCEFHSPIYNPFGANEHKDFIQFTTSNATTQTDGVTIRYNVFNPRDRAVFSQSIFMRNEQVDKGDATFAEMAYLNILIEYNLIYNTNGIGVGEANGVTIRHNTCLKNEDVGTTGGGSDPRLIFVNDYLNVLVENNVTHGIVVAAGQEANVTQIGNVDVQRDDRNAPNHYDVLFFNALVDGQAVNPSLLPELRSIPGTVVDGKGSPYTYFANPATGIDGWIELTYGTGFTSQTVTLDCLNIYDSTGQLSLADLQAATINWNFGDGSVGAGESVVHAYANPGEYRVQCDITTVGGDNVTIYQMVEVTSPILIMLSGDVGAIDTSPNQNLLLADTGGIAIIDDGGGDMVFQMNDGYMQFAGTPEMYELSKFSVHYRFKVPGTDTGFNRHIRFSPNFNIDIGPTRCQCTLTLDDASTPKIDVTLGAATNDDAWHKLTLVADLPTAGTYTVYIDAVQVGQLTGLVGRSLGVDGSAFNLGNPFGAANEVLVDDVFYLGDALTPAQVTALQTQDMLTVLGITPDIGVPDAFTESMFELDTGTLPSGGEVAIVKLPPNNWRGITDIQYDVDQDEVPRSLGTTWGVVQTVLPAPSQNYFKRLRGVNSQGPGPWGPPLSLISNAGASYDADAEAYWTQAAVEPNAARKQIISDFFAGLKTDGVWTMLSGATGRGLHIETPDAVLSLVNIGDPARTAVATGSPTFTPGTGWVGGAAGQYIEDPAVLVNTVFTGPGTGMAFVKYGAPPTHANNQNVLGDGNRLRFNLGASGGDWSAGNARVASSASMGWGAVSGPAAASILTLVRRDDGDANDMHTYIDGVLMETSTQTWQNVTAPMRLWYASAAGVDPIRAWGYSDQVWTTAQIQALNARIETYLAAIAA